MNISDELLARYFKGLCTPEESILVANYLKEIEDLPEHLLKKDEWDDAEDALITSEKSDKIFAAVKSETITRSVKLKRYKTLSAAAIVLVLLTVGVLVFNESRPVAFNSAKRKIKQTEMQAEITWKSFVNYTSNSQSLELPDGSKAIVYPNGELRYAMPFVKQKREIYLKGKSFFQVAKDKKHPFIVYSKEVSTTALGTSFTITANEHAKIIKVELHTGKVWIKNVSNARNLSRFSKILMPGDALVYNELKSEVNVIEKTPLAKELVKSNEVNFNQATLKEVLEKLKERYKIKIIYNEADLNEISFTGTIDLNHKPEKIIKEITDLNELKLTVTKEGYLISK